MIRSTIKPPTMTMAKGAASLNRSRGRERPATAQRDRQHDHHDGAQPTHGAFNGGTFHGKLARNWLMCVAGECGSTSKAHEILSASCDFLPW